MYIFKFLNCLKGSSQVPNTSYKLLMQMCDAINPSNVIEASNVISLCHITACVIDTKSNVEHIFNIIQHLGWTRQCPYLPLDHLRTSWNKCIARAWLSIDAWTMLNVRIFQLSIIATCSGKINAAFSSFLYYIVAALMNFNYF